MTVNVVVDRVQAWQAFARKNLMPVTAEIDLPDTLRDGIAESNVSIEPDPKIQSKSRTIIWKFKFPVAATDDDDLTEFEKILGELLNVAGSGATMWGGTLAQVFLSGKSVLQTIFGAVRNTADILKKDSQYGLISATRFPITFQRSADDTSEKWVGYRLHLESRWVNGNVDDDDNKGYNHCQTLTINDIQHRGTRVVSSKEVTNVYTNLLNRVKVRLRPEESFHPVAYDLISQASADSAAFVNFNTAVVLRINVEDTEKALDDAFALAAADQPQQVGLAVAEAEEQFAGIAVPPTLIASNAPARKLIKMAGTGKILHLGSHLGRMSSDELIRIAEGLGVLRLEGGGDVNRERLAHAIAKAMVKG